MTRAMSWRRSSLRLDGIEEAILLIVEPTSPKRATSGGHKILRYQKKRRVLDIA